MKPNPAEAARTRIQRILKTSADKSPERRRLLKSIEVLKESERRAKVKQICLF